MSSGTITLRRPRVRGVEERFESRVLPLFARRTKELVLTSSRTCLKEGSSKTESPSQLNRGRMPPDTFTHHLYSAEAVGDELGHDHTPTPSGSGRRGAVRESGAAVVREADEGAGPHLLKDVFEGRKFEDGKPVSTQQRKNAA